MASRDAGPFAGRWASVTVTDPWEFMTELGQAPLIGKIEGVAERPGEPVLVVIRLEKAVMFKDHEISMIMATARHVGSRLEQLSDHERGLAVNMLVVPADHRSDALRFDKSWWRDGLGLIGDIRVIDK